MNNLSYGVAIPTGDSFEKKGGSIRHTLCSVLNQTLKPNVISIVSNGTENEHVKIIEFINSLQTDINIKILHVVGSNRPKSRNLAVDVMQNEDFLVFLDDDTVVSETTLIHNLILKIIEEKVDFFYGAQRLWTTPRGWFEENSEPILEEVRKGDCTLLKKNATSDMNIIGRTENEAAALNRSFIANFGIVKRKIFSKVGGFDNELDLFDDDMLTFRLANIGKGISTLKASVFHVNHVQANIEKDFSYYLAEYEKKMTKYNSNFCTLEYLSDITV